MLFWRQRVTAIFAYGKAGRNQRRQIRGGLQVDGRALACVPPEEGGGQLRGEAGELICKMRRPEWRERRRGRLDLGSGHPLGLMHTKRKVSATES